MNYQEENIKNGKHYGIESQLNQTQEEAAELIQAINKYRRARGVGQETDLGTAESRANLVEEIVDVSIMIEQLCDLLLITQSDFDRMYETKVARTMRRRLG